MAKLPRIDDNHRPMTCVYCFIYSQHHFFKLVTSTVRRGIYDTTDTPYHLAVCTACRGLSIWNTEDDARLYPSNVTQFKPHQDLPDSCKTDFNEAADVFAISPRSAAALLRLVIQRLLVELGGSGKNLNDDIGKLVKDGLPEKIQKALDVCRVIGNNAVHPGEIDLNDSPDVVESLFNFINIIVNDRITQPRLLDSEYSNLPKGALDAIDKRDQ